MGVDFVLRLADGTSPVTLPDPSGGTFDAAGDFDRLLFGSRHRLQVLDRADRHGDDILFTHDESEDVLRDVEVLLKVEEGRDEEGRSSEEPGGRRGSARRGLLRLREMAAFCRDHPGSTIVQSGD